MIPAKYFLILIKGNAPNDFYRKLGCMNKQNQIEKKSSWFQSFTLIAILLIAGSAWFFFEITDEVLEGETHEFDTRILLAMRNADNVSDPWGPKWFEELGRDFTALGGIPVLTLILASCVGGMLITDHRKTAYLILFAVIGGAILTISLKSGFDRPRPDLVPHSALVYSKSFPSGHAMLSTVTYLTLGFLMAGTYKRKFVQGYIITVSILIAGIVGISRIYLGVHWPTDVLAGWAIGSSWALLCWLAEYWLRKIGRIEHSE